MNKEQADNFQIQTYVDKFYMKNGKCCAGCDHWRHFGSTVGECANSKIVPENERASMLDFKNITYDIGAGHALTKRDYVCGQFKDTFDWKSLPMMYLRRIGFKNRSREIKNRPE